METKLDLSVILPIKSAHVKDFNDYLKKSIESLHNQQTKFNELIIVHTNEEELVNLLKSFNFYDLNVKMFEWKDEPNYAKQINFGVSKANSEWISFFEFDDEYSSIWFKNVEKYIRFYPDVDAFLPIVVDVNDKNVFAGFTNEATFAANISHEIGYLNNETLHNYQNFQTSGMVLKKNVIDEFGGFKSSMLLTFGYELFLRLTYNNVKIMSIPKIGYKHINLREGSIFWNYKNGENNLTEDEVRFWIDSAKKEYFFSQERDIKYEPQLS